MANITFTVKVSTVPRKFNDEELNYLVSAVPEHFGSMTNVEHSQRIQTLREQTERLLRLNPREVQYLLSKADSSFFDPTLQNLFVSETRRIQNISDIVKKQEAQKELQNKLRESYTDISGVRRRQMQDLRLALSEVRSCISEKILKDIFRELHVSYKEAQISLGSAVGVTAAGSVGEYATQNTLSSFHNSGAASTAKISMGLEALDNILGASSNKENSTPSVDVHLDKSYSFVEIFDKRKDFKLITLKDLILNHENEKIEDMDFFWWHPLYSSMNNLPYPPPSRWGLRIYLDKDKLYDYKIYTSEIARKIKEQCPKSGYVYASPSSEGIIDVYPIPENMSSPPELQGGEFDLDRLSKEKVILDKFITSFAPNIKIQGVNEIEDVFPRENVTWNAVKHVEERYDTKVLSLIRLTQANIDAVNITYRQEYDNLLAAGNRLVTGQGYIVLMFSRNPFTLNSDKERLGDELDYLESYYTNLFPNLMGLAETIHGNSKMSRLWNCVLDHVGISLGVYGLMEISNLMKELKCFIFCSPNKNKDRYLIMQVLSKENPIFTYKGRKEREKKNVLTDFNVTDFNRAATYRYLQTQGSNFLKILNMDGVDSSRTVTNFVHEINEVLGIEAAKKFIIKRVIDIASAGKELDTDPRHIEIAADFMTNRGVIDPITNAGISAQIEGTLPLASFEHTYKHITRGSMGVPETSDSVSTSLILGKRAKIGASAVEVEEASQALLGDEVDLDELFKDETAEAEPYFDRDPWAELDDDEGPVDPFGTLEEEKQVLVNFGEEAKPPGNFQAVNPEESAIEMEEEPEEEEQISEEMENLRKQLESMQSQQEAQGLKISGPVYNPGIRRFFEYNPPDLKMLANISSKLNLKSIFD